ncbi:MAG TPA: hypothetical protein DEO38_00030 [Bacteroidales bacterium]|nr:hypothetical protein [Bacteroidales bacterium]
MHKAAHIITIFIVMVLLCTCNNNSSNKHPRLCPDLVEIVARDTLRIATMTGPTSYFYYRDQEVGYDYELAQELADYLQLTPQYILARTHSEMLHMLQNGQVDIIAYNLAPLRIDKGLKFWPIHEKSQLVLLQHKSAQPISSVQNVADTKIHVARNSIFEQHIKNLNEETGGQIRIVLTPDTMREEELVADVNSKKIDATVIYKNTYQLFRKKYHNITTSAPISVSIATGWVTNTEAEELNSAIERWLATLKSKHINALRRKYFVRTIVPHRPFSAKLVNGTISPYDNLFRKYAPEINWDWRLLAALCYHESRFNPNTTSPMGACGLMQLVPVTAKRYGLTDENCYDPEESIKAGVQYIKFLNDKYAAISQTENRINFILASYNAGPAHIFDAKALARKYGQDDKNWQHVKKYLLLKSEPEYYNDPVCKYGYYRGTAAVNYVEKVIETYHVYEQIIK